MQNTQTQYIKQQIKNRYNQFNTLELFRLFEQQYSFKKMDHCFAIYEILLARNVPIPKEISNNITDLNSYKKNLEQCFSHFKTDRTGWRVEKFGNNSCSSKIMNKSQIMMIFEGVLDIDFFRLASMIYEAAKYSEWFPFCKQSLDILNIGLAEKLVFLTIGIPFLSNRQAYMRGQAFNRIQTSNLINLYVSSVTGDKQLQKKYNVNLQINQKSVELDLKFLTVELTMIKPSVFDFKMFIHMDINFQIIPEMVLGYMSKKFGEFLFNKMMERANSLDQKVFQQKLSEKTLNFYHWLDITVKEWEKHYHDKLNPPKVHQIGSTKGPIQTTTHTYPQVNHIHNHANQNIQYIGQQQVPGQMISTQVSQIPVMNQHAIHIQNINSHYQQNSYQQNVIKK